MRALHRRSRNVALSLSLLVSLAGPAATSAAAAVPTIVPDASVVEVDENQLADLHGTYADADGDPIALTASEGSIEKESGTSSGTWRWTAPALDGPYESVVTVAADDGGGPPVTASFTYRIRNVAPTTWTTGPRFVPAGSASSRLFRYFAGDVPADAPVAVLSCGGGTQVGEGPTIISGIRYVRCSFAAAGSRLVGVQATDKDGASSDGRITTTATTQVTSMADGRLIIDGPVGNDYMGGAVAAVDLNVDGLADLAIGSGPPDSSLPPDPGYVEIVLGRPDAGTLTVGSLPAGAGWRITGPAGEQLGKSLASAGDVNHDGKADLLIGAPNADAYAGAVYVVYGSASIANVNLATMPLTRGFRIAGAADGDFAGTVVAGAGDIDGDGFDDILVGAPNADVGAEAGAGTAYVVLGAASSGNVDLGALPADRGFRITGAASRTGAAVAGGDVNGDGLADAIVAGSVGWDSRVIVAYGRADPTDIDGTTLPASRGFTIGGGEGLGIAALASGDIDGDGFDDIVVAHPGWNAGGGDSWPVSIVRGGSTNASLPYMTPSTRLLRIRAADEAFGTALAVLDANKDGRQDVLVGARFAKHNDDHSGSAYLIRGTATLDDIDVTELDPRWSRIDGDLGYAFAGWGVAGGDVNGDGTEDIVVGQTGVIALDSGNRGRVSVFGAATPDTIAPRVTAPGQKVLSPAALDGSRPVVRLSWTGSDAGSGVARYEIARKTNSGAWTVLSTTATSTSRLQSLATGKTYRFRVRAVDGAGNKSPWVYGTTFRLSAYSEANQAIRYKGHWTTKSNKVFVGDRAKSSSAAGAKATFQFTGRSIALVSRLGPTRGKVAIYVNGTRVATVDLHAAKPAGPNVVWSRSWSSSNARTVVVRVVGTKGHPRFDLDGFVAIR
jgi:FG-GAP repeat/FG-GAP-like repeat/Fibronectin type III domain